MKMIVGPAIESEHDSVVYGQLKREPEGVGETDIASGSDKEGTFSVACLNSDSGAGTGIPLPSTFRCPVRLGENKVIDGCCSKIKSGIVNLL